MRRILFDVFEAVVRTRTRSGGVGVYRDTRAYFGPDGLDGALAYCDRVNRDLAGYLKPAEPPLPANPGRRLLATDRSASVTGEELMFDSPLPSGIPTNDRVRIRLWSDRGGDRDGRVVVFHHPFHQKHWGRWRWFLEPLIRRIPVAMMVSPWHFDRTPPGWFPGEGLVNPNPALFFRGIRQWFADQRATHELLVSGQGLRPVAVVGFSLGAWQSLLAGSFGELDLPLVSIASTNRYAFGLTHGHAGRHVVAAMERAGVDRQMLYRMVESVELERYVSPLHGRPVLMVRGLYDRVDPPPSGERLERALRPARAIRIRAGHGTLMMFRGRMFREIIRFLEECGAL